MAGCARISATDSSSSTQGSTKWDTILVLLNWSMGLLDALASSYRVIAVDLRGHGLSDKPRDPKAYGVRFVDDVTNLLDYLDIERAHLVGYSMGAAITAKLLVTHPERVLSASGFCLRPDYAAAAAGTEPVGLTPLY